MGAMSVLPLQQCCKSHTELGRTNLSPVSVREETGQDLPPPLQTPHIPQDCNVEGGAVGGAQQVEQQGGVLRRGGKTLHEMVARIAW